MKIEKILVDVDNHSASLGRLEAGLNLAKHFGASLTALCVVPMYSPVVTGGALHGGWYVGEELSKNQRKEALTAAGQVQKASERLAKNFASEFHWVQRDGALVEEVCAEMPYHDILITNRPDTLNESKPHMADLNDIILSCGKAVLVLPRVMQLFNVAPRNILLAWDESREAIQAMHHAMPFLEAATSVMVVSAYKRKERRKAVAEQADKLARYLQRHQVNASSHALKKGHFSTGELLADYAQESETDLIVMGAYGHSRFREIVMGGATRHMLQHTPLPVLFAH